MRATLLGISAVLICSAVSFGACTESVLGPNEIGGETDLELTEVGNEFPVNLSASEYSGPLNRLQDSTVILSNEDGIVTFQSRFQFDSAFVAAIDSILGTADLPEESKREIVDTYLDRYGATLDTTNREAMTATVQFKMKITSEGIQEFVNSKGNLSRPFTIVKYDAAVGDQYTFTTDEGVDITRTVTRKSSEDDYPIGFWLIKVVEVEEEREDILIPRIKYYANHKFGLVGMEIFAGNGETLRVGILPPTL